MRSISAGLRLPRSSAGLLVLALSGCNCDDQLGGLRGSLVVEPEVLSFGEVPVGAEKQLQLTMRNKGSYLLMLEGLTTAAPFSVASNTSSIGIGGSVTAMAAFRPTAVGAVAGTLTITSNDQEAPTIEVPMSGTGIEAAVVVDPLIVDFGEVLWTTETLIPEKRSVTVTNPGTDSFDLTALELAGDGAGAFTLDPQQAVKTYGPRESQTFEVGYLPNAMGPVEGQVRIRTTAPNGAEIMVTLRGTGVGPVLDLCSTVTGQPEVCGSSGTPPRIDFGLLDRGGSATGQIRVVNTGDRDLTAQGLVQGAATEFTFNPDLATFGEFVLTPGQSQSFAVSYTAADYLFDSIIVAFGTRAAVRSATSLRVEARIRRADINVVPARVTMSLLDQSQHDQVDIGIYNCGQGPLTVSSVALNQTAGPTSAFTLSSAPAAGTVIQPQTDCMNPPAGASFTVAFDSATPGTYTANVAIGSSDPVDPTVNVEITATKR